MTEWWECLVRVPLRNLYTNGPSGLGFWGGATSATICAKLNPSTDADFWSSSALAVAQCEAQVVRDMESFMVFSETAIYALLLYELAKAGVTLIVSGLAATPSTLYRGCKNMASCWKEKEEEEDVGASSRI